MFNSFVQKWAVLVAILSLTIGLSYLSWNSQNLSRAQMTEAEFDQIKQSKISQLAHWKTQLEGKNKDLSDSQRISSILMGQSHIEKTYQNLPENVGAKMSCTNCHLQAGTTKYAGHFIGIAHAFPQYRDRSAKMDTLKDRVNDCFIRSLNGKALELDSKEMLEIVSYMEFLSEEVDSNVKPFATGMPKIKLAIQPDIEEGAKSYQAQCAHCHQASGVGIIAAEQVIYPSLWGATSFNIGAGMARLQTATGFIKYHMPLGQPQSLTDQEALNIAAFVIQQPRPDYLAKSKDWPKGNKPIDARY